MSGDEVTEKALDDEFALRQLLNGLPIYASRIGIRSNSTPEQTEFMHFLFQVHEQWREWSAAHPEASR